MKPKQNAQPSGSKGPHRFYYGWVIVMVVAALSFAGGTETNPVLGIFQAPMTEEFGWSRSLYTAPMAIGTILGGLIGIFVGPAIDRYGGRWIYSVAVGILGATFILEGMVQELWQHFALQIIGRGVLTGSFFLIMAVVIPKWFIVKRGRAIGFAGIGQRSGQTLFPLIAERATVAGSWRTGWVVLGVLVWTVALIPTLLFMRRKPEDMGLLPDGVKPEEVRVWQQRSAQWGGKPKVREEEVSATRREVLHTPAFYLLAIAVSINSFVVTGVHFHWYSYMTGNGISSGTAITSVILAPMIGVPVAVLAGFVVERVHVRYLLIISYVVLVGAIIFLLQVDIAWHAYTFGALMGLVNGINVTTNQMLWSEYFGRGSVGAIRGMTSPPQMLSNAMGPFVGSLIFDSTQSYTLTFTISGILVAVGIVFLLLARPPRIQPKSIEQQAL
jgi:MFS family permease